MTAATVALQAFLWWAVLYTGLLLWRAETNDRRERDEARRLPRIDTRPRQINQIRRDPSPTPRQRAS